MDAAYLFVGKFIVWGVGFCVLGGALAYALGQVGWTIADRVLGVGRIFKIRDELRAAESVVWAVENNTGAEPSVSVLGRAIDEYRELRPKS